MDEFHTLSRFSFRRPQCRSFCVESNARSTFRFNGLMMPIRANIVGPPSASAALIEVGNSINADHHSLAMIEEKSRRSKLVSDG
jgi:hypothetical protein